MKLALLTALLALVLPLSAVAAATTQPAKPDTMSENVQAIMTATDPSAAIQAYAAAVSTDAMNPQVYEVYIKRMIDFGMSDLLAKPAQTLVRLDPDSGLGWAVVGFHQAQAGNMADAFTDALLAVRLQADDPFVLQFMGQLAAWYDHQPNQAGLSPMIKQAVAAMRKYNNRDEYVASYMEAAAALSPQGQASQPASISTDAYNPQQGQPYYQRPDGSQDNNYYYYSSSPGYYAPYGSYYYGDTSYPYGYYPYYSSYPYYCGPVVFFSHRHGEDRDSDHHHGAPMFHGSGGRVLSTGSSGMWIGRGSSVISTTPERFGSFARPAGSAGSSQFQRYSPTFVGSRETGRSIGFSRSNFGSYYAPYVQFSPSQAGGGWQSAPAHFSGGGGGGGGRHR